MRSFSRWAITYENIDAVSAPHCILRSRSGVTDVAPGTFKRSPRCSRTRWKSAPSSCIARSLNASVGPLESSSSPSPGPASAAAQYRPHGYRGVRWRNSRPCMSRVRAESSSGAMSSANFPITALARSAYESERQERAARQRLRADTTPAHTSRHRLPTLTANLAERLLGRAAAR